MKISLDPCERKFTQKVVDCIREEPTLHKFIKEGSKIGGLSIFKGWLDGLFIPTEL